MKRLLVLVFLFSFLAFSTSLISAVTNLRQSPTATPTQSVSRLNTDNFQVLEPTVTPVPTISLRRVELATPTPSLSVSTLRNALLITPTPKPASGLVTIGGIDLNIEKDKIGQERWLNPQPEPPIYISTELRKMGTSAELTWPAIATETVKSKVEFTPDGALLDLPDIISGNESSVKMLIKPEFKTRGNEIFVMDGDKEVKLMTTPMVLWGKLNSVASKNKVKLSNDFSLALEQGRAVFSITISEPVKIFGLFPSMMKAKVVVNDVDGKTKITQKPWYSFVVKEAANVIGDMELLPNLVLKDLRFIPDKFNDWDSVKMEVTIANEGPVVAFAMPRLGLPGEQGGATVSLYITENGIYSEFSNKWSPVLIYLEPGQEWIFDTFDKVTMRCGEDYKIKVATEEFNPEETSKDDNIITGKINCQ